MLWLGAKRKDEEGAGERSKRGRVDEGERLKTCLGLEEEIRKDEEVLVKEAKGTC